jgi:RNA polymerase sigma-54 factor
MKVSAELGLSHEQRIIMTQKMQLSIKILQMSAAELRDYLNQEFLTNPLLEYEDQPEATAKMERMMDFTERITHGEWGDYANDSWSAEAKPSPFNFIPREKSLKEYLYEQINQEFDLDESMQGVCFYLVESLNDYGYLDIGTEDLCRELRLPGAVIEEAVQIVQSLEPMGIGARNLQECLKIQLVKKGITDGTLVKIIDEYLSLVADHKYNRIAKYLSVDACQVQTYCNILKSLEPKPSRGFFTGEGIRFIVPDAYLRKIGDQYHVILNDDIIPKLNISHLYRRIRLEENEHAADYIHNKLNDAFFLMKSLEKRKNTIYNIIAKIIEFQREYFDYGSEYLKPMSYKELADKLNIHESTVCRAIRNKYFSTHRGVFILKNLFSAGISLSNSHDAVSTVTVKSLIKDLIKNEDQYHPFSDQTISARLNQRGIDISRRTVAKYREEMTIQPSNKRRIFE